MFLAERLLTDIRKRIAHTLSVGKTARASMCIFSVEPLTGATLSHADYDDLRTKLNGRFVAHGVEAWFIGGDCFTVVLPNGENKAKILAAVQSAFATPRLKLIAGFGHLASDTKEAFVSAQSAWLAAKRSGQSTVDLETYYSTGEVQDFLSETPEPDADHFVVWYQPKRRAVSPFEVVGYEALARLRVNQGKVFVPPSDRVSPNHGKSSCFLKAVRAHGLQSAFDTWLMGAVSQAVLAGKKISVNILASSLDEHFDRIVEMAFPRSDDLSGLEIEILEHEELEGKGVETVRRLSERFGIRFAIDDFGKQLSNIAALEHLPQGSTVKLDQSYVRTARGHPPKQIQVAAQHAIAHLAHAHDLFLVLEGVEDSARDSLCDRFRNDVQFNMDRVFLQGYLMGGEPKPVFG